MSLRITLLLTLSVLLCATPARSQSPSLSLVQEAVPTGGTGYTGNSFGNIVQGGFGTYFYILTNSGAGVAIGISINYTGTNAADFGVLSSPPAVPVLYPVTTCAIAASPSGATESSSTVTITTASSCPQLQNNQVVHVYEVGGQLDNNSSFNGPYAISGISGNTFQYTSTRTGLTASGDTGNGQSQVVIALYAPCGSSLPANLSCYIAVKFTPSGTSAESATLNVAGSNFTTLTQALTGTGVSGTAVGACGTISSGGNYYLTANLSASGTCITITAADAVDLNLNGHSITFGTGTVYGVPVYGVKHTSGSGIGTVHDGSVIQGDCRNPSTWNNPGGDGASSSGDLGAVRGNIAAHDVSLSHCSDSSGGLFAPYWGGGYVHSSYNVADYPNEVTARRRAEYFGFAMQSDSQGADTSPEVFHDFYIVGTSPQGGLDSNAGINVALRPKSFPAQSYVSIGNPNGTSSTTTMSGTVGVTMNSTAVTWVSGFSNNCFPSNLYVTPLLLNGTIDYTFSPTGCTTGNLATNYLGTTGTISAAVDVGAQDCGSNPWQNSAGTSPSNAGTMCTNDYAVNLVSPASAPGYNITVNNTEGRGYALTSEVGSNSINNVQILNASEVANNAEYSGCELGGGYGLQFKQDSDTVYTASSILVITTANACGAQALRHLDSNNYSIQSSSSSFTAKRLSGAPNNCTANGSSYASQDCALAITVDAPSGDGISSDEKFQSINDTFTFDTGFLMMTAFTNPPNGFKVAPIFRGSTFIKGANPGTYFHFWPRGFMSSNCYPMQVALIDPIYSTGFTSSAFVDSDWPQFSSCSFSQMQAFEAFTVIYSIQDMSSRPISGAVVTSTDSYGHHYTCTTNSSGQCAPVDSIDFGFSTQGIPPVNRRQHNIGGANLTDTGYNPYSLTITAPGCTTLNQSGITLNAIQTIVKQLAGCSGTNLSGSSISGTSKIGGNASIH
jgi:hypothetical protein